MFPVPWVTKKLMQAARKFIYFGPFHDFSHFGRHTKQEHNITNRQPQSKPKDDCNCQNKATYAINDQNCQTASLIYKTTLEKCIGLCKTNLKKTFRPPINCLWTTRKIANSLESVSEIVRKNTMQPGDNIKIFFRVGLFISCIV